MLKQESQFFLMILGAVIGYLLRPDIFFISPYTPFILKTTAAYILIGAVIGWIIGSIIGNNPEPNKNFEQEKINFPENKDKIKNKHTLPNILLIVFFLHSIRVCFQSGI